MPALENLKWEKFALAYVECFNKSEAFRRAGCFKTDNARSLIVRAQELYNKPEIQARIKELIRDLRKTHDITINRVILETSAIAFADYTEVISAMDGNELTIKNIKQLPKRLRVAIKSVSSTRFGLKVEFHDKMQALDMLSRHLGVYELESGATKLSDGPAIYLPDNGRPFDPEQKIEDAEIIDDNNE